MKMHLAKLTITAAVLGVAAFGSAQAADNPIRIGVALSRSGNLADSAKLYWSGLELWSEQVNAHGGLLGRKVKLISYDDRSDPATAARLYEKLISDDKVDLLFGPWGSASSATAAAVANKHHRIFFNSGGASEQIEERGFKYLFQTAPAISAYVANIGPLAAKYHLKTLVFFGRDYPAARDMLKDMKAVAKKQDLKILDSEFFPAGTTDFSSLIAKARQLNPDIWLSIGYPNEAIEMVRQMKASNYLPKVFIHNGASITDFMTASGKNAEYVFGISLYEPTLKTKGNAEFVKAYQQKYNRSPAYYSAFAYAGATVMGRAVEQAKSLDQDKLREVLKTFQTDTVMGHHKVDPVTHKQVGVTGLLVQIRNGKREIVMPEDLKTMDPVIPMPAWDKR
ncbi:amino acid ABC transporter substrate-binding protein [Candidimonas humi]|uniref:Amino acid ABC transporter substrate-binding protein n=1 Tax=Candidimonas humi TaxID=683355 RepID=A0ABV8NVL9_9BURK|nr:amino acid ABC transporter substrate-binding protein [Candidimonas humi]MBV6304510.1 amino acid ABC transporter substrate-binding protein [Candidimonas humi]